VPDALTDTCINTCTNTFTDADMNVVQCPPADRKILEIQTDDYRTVTQRTEAQLNSRFIPIALKRFVFARSNGQCEFVDPRTKIRCGSKFRLQIDHKLPRALGGQTESSNLRHLCSTHNLRMASQAGLHKPNSAGLHKPNSAGLHKPNSAAMN
jgi:5-methylcytosine-specific restriction endonuclease McrA